MVYGESLGGWASQDVFLKGGVDAIKSRGVDEAIWVGSPRMAGLKTSIFGRGHTFGIDKTGHAAEFDSAAELARLTKTSTAQHKPSVFFFSQRNDPVAKFAPDILWKRPEWLGRADAALGVPSRTKWMPGTTFVNSTIDAINGTISNPGTLGQSGHQYGASIAPAISEMLELHPSKGAMDRLMNSLSQLELARVAG